MATVKAGGLCHVLRGLSFLAALLVFLGVPDAARSAGFSDDVQGKTTIYLKDIPGVGKTLADLGLGKLANTQMAGVTATADTISGFVNFLAMRWNFLVFKAKSETFFALEPVTASGAPRAPKITDFINPKVKPIKDMMDLLTLDRLVWVVAARTVELDQNSLPAAVKTMFSPYFGNSTLSVEFGQGVTFLGAQNIGKVAILKQAIEAIGGQSSTVLVKAGFQTSVLDSMLSGSAPSIEATFQAALPPIKPKIGGKIQLPTTFTVSLLAAMNPLEGTVKLGFVADAADVPFAYPDIAKKKPVIAKTAMDLQVAVAFEGGKPVFSIAGTMFKGEQGRLKQAFGLPFLDLQDYTMEFELKADAVAVGIGAGGRFYNELVTLFAAVQVPAQTAGIPIPDQIKIMVEPVNANSVGSLSLRDLTNAFADLTNAVTGSRIPKPNLPKDFMQIAGVEKGVGPFIDINLNMGLDAGLEMGGKMVVFGTEMGVIETAVLKPTHGIEIKGHSDVDLPVDVLKLPKGEIDIAVTKDNITDPHVRIKVETISVLGSKGSFEFSIDKKQQVAIVEGASPFGLFDASLVLESNTGNIKSPNFDATGIIVGDWFNKFADGVQTATADIAKGVETAVAGMNDEIHVFSGRLSQAKIDKTTAVNDLEAARKSAYSEFNKALAEVDKLEGKYKKEKGKCGSPPWKWDHCVAAGALWTSLQTARGVLKIAQKVVDEFLKGTGKVLAAVVDGLNKSIKLFADTIEVAAQGLGTAMSTFGGALELAGKFAGEALSFVADVFDVEKLWMKGKLAVLSGSQKGQLGVEYTLLSKTYLKDVSWDFKVPVDKVFEVFVPGSPDSSKTEAASLPGNAPKAVQVAGKFTYNPVTTAGARSVSESMIEAGQLKALSVPFNPEVCEAHPYALEEQIGVVEDELQAVSWRKRNADILLWTKAMEDSPEFMALRQNPKSPFVWMPSGRGKSLPSNAVSGGKEPGRPNLHICRGTVENGKVWASGKVVAGNCNVGWKGKEYTLSTYDVLTGDQRALMPFPVPFGKWNGKDGIYVGQENGGAVQVCAAPHKDGLHPGKIAPNGSCYFGYGGKELKAGMMYMAYKANPSYGHDFSKLVSGYEEAKKSYAERESAARYNRQGTILKGLGGELGKVASSHQVRKALEANFRKDYKLPEQLSSAFLGDQEKRLRELDAELKKLRSDPASPCGQVAKEQGVKPANNKPAPGLMNAMKKDGFGSITKQVLMAQSLMAQAVAKAADQQVQAQKTAQKAAREKIRREQLLAFTKRVREHYDAGQKRAALAMKVRAQRDDIRFLPATVSAAQRNAAAAAAKAAAAAAKNAKVVKEKPRAVRRSVRGEKEAKQLAALKALPKVQQEAFSKAFEKSQARLGADHAQLRQNRQKDLQQELARRNARMAKRLAKAQGLDDAQRKALSEVYALAAVRGRADMLKRFPVSRQSSLAGRPSAEGQAAKETSTVVQDVANVKPDFRKNLRTLGINVR
jgi:hypothetical protein